MKNSGYLEKLLKQAESMLSSLSDYSVRSPEFVAWKTQIERYLSDRFGIDSVEYKAFHERQFHPMAIVSSSDPLALKVLRAGIETTKIELENYWSEECEIEHENTKSIKVNDEIDYKKVFIVHGHNEAMKEATARLLEQQGIEGIILHEQPNRGKTIIEKFERFSDVGAAIILFTKDDKGRAKEEKNDYDRARQNVVFEAGYFMGKYGRERVVLVAENGVEMPSDLAGVIYTNGDVWKLDVCRELKDMGFNIDTNKLI